MAIYLLKFSACLLVFWLFYIFILERQSMHMLKRMYLLGALALALWIPTFSIIQYVEPVTLTMETIPLEYMTTAPISEPMVVQEPAFWNFERTLWVIYTLGVLVFSIRFILNLKTLYTRISTHPQISKPPFIYVLLKQQQIPHSFFRYLFFNKQAYKNQKIPKEVILHEETHARQWHSLDILVIELVQIALWFHPLIYILKHHIKLNHEFLADQAVINSVDNPKTYQKLLLQFSSSTQNNELSSAINYSSFKKRFTVMKTQTSKTRIWVSSLILLPIVAILFYSFAEREYKEKEPIETSELLQAENQTTDEGATEAMMQEYNDWMKKLNNKTSSLFIPVGTWERLVAIYDLMSEEQRESVKTLPILQEVNSNLYSVKPNKPTATQFETWKNEKKFAIWVDGKHISNSELNNYKVNDIVHYIGSGVSKNAKSKEFPQAFQFRLYTENGFNKFFKEGFVSSYKELSNEYAIAIRDYLKGPQTDNSELKIIKAQADKFYNQFTKEELDKYNILPAPPVPADQKTPKTILSILIKDNGDLIINNRPGDLSTLETFLQNLDIPKDYTISFKTEDQVSQTDTEKVLQLLKTYKVLFDSNPIEMPTQQEKATAKQVTAYNAWAKAINQKMAKAKANNEVNAYPIVKTKEVRKYKAIYNRMTETQRKSAEPWPNFPPPPPPAPEPPKPPKAIKQGDNVPPPPPPPMPKNPQGNLSKGHVNAYNEWMKHIKKENSNPKLMTEEVYNAYRALYNAMTEKQKEMTEGLPPPPPPLPKPIKKGDNMPPPSPRSKKVTEAYVKAHPESVSKAKINGEIVEVVEIPSDQEGTTEIYGKKYKYVIKDGFTTYYDSKDKKYNEKEFKKYIESQKSLRMKLDNSEDDTNISGLKGMSFTFSSLKNAKKIDWDLEKAFKENFEKLNNGDSIRVVLEIDDKIMIDNKIIRNYKTEFIGTFDEVNNIYAKIKQHIKELKRK